MVAPQVVQGPGIITVFDALTHLASHGVTEIDFGLGVNAYKEKFGATTQPVDDVFLSRWPLICRLASRPAKQQQDHEE